MLEETEIVNVVSWGPKGDSFVVKDMNEFTKSVLPRIFKHSNFASFVRQLNKYDFHKLKNSDDSPFGEQVRWFSSFLLAPQTTDHSSSELDIPTPRISSGPSPLLRKYQAQGCHLTETPRSLLRTPHSPWRSRRVYPYYREPAGTS